MVRTLLCYQGAAVALRSRCNQLVIRILLPRRPSIARSNSNTLSVSSACAEAAGFAPGLTMGELKSQILQRHAKAAKENDKGYKQTKVLFHVAQPVMILVGTLTCALMLFYIVVHPGV